LWPDDYCINFNKNKIIFMYIYSIVLNMAGLLAVCGRLKQSLDMAIGDVFWRKDALVDAGDAPALIDAGKKIGPVKQGLG